MVAVAIVDGDAGGQEVAAESSDVGSKVKSP